MYLRKADELRSLGQWRGTGLSRGLLGLARSKGAKRQRFERESARRGMPPELRGEDPVFHGFRGGQSTAAPPRGYKPSPRRGEEQETQFEVGRARSRPTGSHDSPPQRGAGMEPRVQRSPADRRAKRNPWKGRSANSRGNRPHPPAPEGQRNSGASARRIPQICGFSFGNLPR